MTETGGTRRSPSSGVSGTGVRSPLSGDTLAFGQTKDVHRALEGPALYQLLVESVRDYAIFALGPEGHILTWNAGAERLKGYASDEIIGRHFSVFYPPEDVDAGKTTWELEVASRDGRVEDEGWRVRKDGSRFWALVVITALRDATGELVGFAKVTRDLTERRLGEQRALEDARRIAAAEGANKAKSEFLAAMSHELRTPLNAIGGYVQLMEVGVTGPLTEQQLGYLSRIRGSQQHLLGIITDLLNYSRIEAGQLTYDIEDVAADVMLREVLPLVAPQATSKQLAFEQGECPPGLLVRADRVKAQQVLLNLLSNAVKFTPEGGRIAVHCADAGARVVFTVTDTGPGVPEDKQVAIFEPFVQLGRTHSAAREGTGLGLAISRDLARAMDGDVTVTSKPGEGSTFALSLPKAASASRTG
jgi:PAS domain S-box-containing protein